MPVSVEAVRGYLDAAKDLGVRSEAAVTQLLIDLAGKVHPLVLGEIFRSRVQIRFLAEKLLAGQVTDQRKVKEIIDFLCADSGSHDYTVNRREAESLGLKIEKPTQEFYAMSRQIHLSYAEELKLLEPYSPQALLGANQRVNITLVRGLVESTEGGCYASFPRGP